MQITTTTTAALTRNVTIREYVAKYAPGLDALLLDPDTEYRELEAEGHDEAQRLGLPVATDGAYPAVIWNAAWVRRGF